MPSAPNDANFSAQFSELNQLLACPACHGELRLEAARVICSSCGKSYPIVDGIPVLIPNSVPKTSE